MFRSTVPFKPVSISLLVALALLLAAGAASLFITRPHSAPMANAVSAAKPAASAPQPLDLGAGYRLEWDGSQGKIVPPTTILKPGPQTIDIGAGYRLELDGGSGKIVPPARPSTEFKRIDLGAGYVLELTDESGRIVPPAASFKPQPNTYVDLGAGYRLELSRGGGKIIPPASPVSVQQAAIEQKTYLGGGYWLVTWPTGGQVIKEGSR